MTDPARLAHDAIVRCVCQQTGLDGYTADLIVADASVRGADSPHFGMVRPAAQAVFDEVARPVTAAVDQFIKSFMPRAIKFGQAINEAMNRLCEQQRPAMVAVAKLAHDYDQAQHPRRHKRECTTCREATA